jgi:hypothetical protein
MQQGCNFTYMYVCMCTCDMCHVCVCYTCHVCSYSRQMFKKEIYFLKFYRVHVLLYILILCLHYHYVYVYYL